MSIGQFSRLTRLSVRMLRHYDLHGVLTPAEVDEWTGHRRYHLDQAERAVHIRQLRDVGFGVSAIGALLRADRPATARALDQQRHELLRELRIAQQRVDLITSLIEGESTMSFTLSEAQITTRPAMTLIALRGIIPDYQSEGQLWARFTPELHRQGIEPIGPGGVLENQDHFQETDVDCSVWVPVATSASCVAPLEKLELPSTEVVEVQLTGDYRYIGEAVSSIIAACQRQGLQTAGPAYNIYLTDPSQTPTEENLTRVGIPVRRS